MKLWPRTLQYELVKKMAFEIWERRVRTGEPGTAEDDWYEAEERLRW